LEIASENLVLKSMEMMPHAQAIGLVPEAGTLGNTDPSA
jgi:hypothetical protein